MTAEPLVIGLVGSFGSGCTYIAKEILAKEDMPGGAFFYTSLSQALRDEANSKSDYTSKNNREKKQFLQQLGDARRKENPVYLAEKAIENVKKRELPNRIVFDSIRNPAEIAALRREYRRFYLLGIFSDAENRWKRVRTEFDDDHGAFEKADENDKGGDKNDSTGQQVSQCFTNADIIIVNDMHFDAPGNESFRRFEQKIRQYVALCDNAGRDKSLTKPESDEFFMAAAYSASFRSTCMQRKVGALVVEKNTETIISSGFNEVPKSESSCWALHTQCYRKKLRSNFLERVKSYLAEEHFNQVKAEFGSTFKNLDYCRALHAEEMALTMLARCGPSTSLDNCILYTTTYPCNLCANKIQAVGIKSIVYFEPYPMPQAKTILEKAHVTAKMFEGVTYQAYFRLYGDMI